MRKSVLHFMICFGFLLAAILGSAASRAEGQKDYYAILGISKDATPEQIKKAYRKNARRYNPDVNPDSPDAEAKFKDVNEAYHTLIDFEKRAAYDRNETESPPSQKKWRDRTSNRPIPDPEQQVDAEFQFFRGWGADINPLSHPGLHTTSLLNDFSYDEMLSRTGEYERFTQISRMTWLNIWVTVETRTRLILGTLGKNTSTC